MLINEIIRRRNKTKRTKRDNENLTKIQREGMDRMEEIEQVN
jgi:hypothetical protein